MVGGGGDFMELKLVVKSVAKLEMRYCAAWSRQSA